MTPYFPFPLSHGGAVRIYNLLREAARDFDVFLFSFIERPSNAAHTPLLDFCAKVIAFEHPRYRQPRWSSLLPPEVNQFSSPYVRSTLEEYRRRFGLQLLQVEYTQMASYGGEILVEHDVTFDLHQQVARANSSAAARWDLRRWWRFEKRAVSRYPRVVVMSDKDAALLGNAQTCVSFRTGLISNDSRRSRRRRPTGFSSSVPSGTSPTSSFDGFWSGSGRS